MLKWMLNLGSHYVAKKSWAHEKEKWERKSVQKIMKFSIAIEENIELSFGEGMEEKKKSGSFKSD